MKKIILAYLFTAFAVVVKGHTDHVGGDTSLPLGTFLVIILCVGLIIAGLLWLLYKRQSKPGSLPMKSIIIAITITYVLNVIIFAIFYLEVNL